MKPKKSRWWKTALKALVFLVVCLVTLAVLFAATLSFMGRREWARVKADLTARGERLSLTEMQPPPIPEAQNFFGDPMWAELTDLVDVEVEADGLKMTQKQIRLPDGQRQLDGLHRPLTAEERAALRAAFPKMKVSENANPLRLIGEAYDEGRQLDPAGQRQRAEFIMAILPACEPVLSRLDKLGERPGAWLPLSSQDLVVSASSQVNYLMRYGQLLAARSWAELVQGRNAEASRDVVTCLRLPEALANSPLYLFLLMRVATASQAIDTVREGLAFQSWSDRELAEIDRALMVMNYPAAMAQAVRGERGFGNQMFERIYQKKGETPAEKAWSSQEISPYLWIFGAGDDARRNMLFQTVIDALDRVPGEGLGARSFATFQAEHTALRSSAWNFLRFRITALTFPDFTNVAGRAALLQDRIIQTRIAVALERYRLRHGAYPDSLAALVPEFLPAVPVDVATLLPPKYTREPSGGFSLQSPGWDALDGGKDDVVWGK